MKTIKFRLVKKDKSWTLQIRSFIFFWKNVGEYSGAEAGSYYQISYFDSKKDAIKELKKFIKYKEDKVIFKQLPTIKYF